MAEEFYLKRIEQLKKALADSQTKEHQLKEQNFILQTIFDNSTNAIFALDTQYRYTSFNEQHKINMKMIYGADIEIGKVALDYITNIEDRIYSEKNLTRALSGEYLIEEAAYGTDELTRRYYQITHTPIKNDAGQIIGIAFLALDITDKKTIESKNKHAKELLERTNTVARIGTWEVDLLTRKTIWSRLVRQIHEVSEDFIPSINNAYLFYKEGTNRNQIHKLVKQAIETGNTWDAELQIITAKGNEIWIRTIGITEFENGQCMRVYGTFQDIDARKRGELLIKQQNEELLATEEELRVNLDELIKIQANLEIQQQALLISEERYRKVVETQIDFVMLSTPDTSIVFANEPLANALGTTPSQMIGLKWIDFAMPEDIQFIAQKIEALTPEDNTFINENRDKRADGTWGWTQWIDQGLFDDKQNLIQIQSVGRDITLLKETQARLDGERQRFQNIVDSVDGIVWEADMDTFQFTYISQKAKRLLGYEIEEWYQADFWKKHLYSGDKDKVLDYHVAYSKNATSHEFEYRFVAKNGDIIWLRDITTVCQDENGLPILRGIMVDISEIKKAEQNIKIRIEQLNATLEYAPNVAIQWYDIDGRVLYWNKSSETMYGWKAEEAVGKTLKELIHTPEEEEAFLSILQEITKTNQPYGPYEARISHRNGTEGWVWATTFAIPIDEGKIGFVCMDVDITARKKMADELHRLALVAKGTSNIVIITDLDYKMTWVNEGFTRITGYSFEEALGKSPKMFQFEKTNHETIKLIGEKLSKREAIKCEILNKGKYGQIYWVEMEIQPLIDEQGNHTGFMAIESDITERKKSQEELLHLMEITGNQNQRLSEYAYITSHNIRSSVANMMGLTNFLREEPENTNYLDMLESSVHQLDATIKTMNDLLDMEIETETIEKKSINLLRAVNNNIALIQTLTNQVSIKIDIAEALTAFTIPVYLDSILNNLLTNAIKYRRNDIEAKIDIFAYKQDNAVVLEIKDNGVGMDLNKYKDKLFKFKSRLTNKVEGKGIGLFFTKHQIEAMGGKIEVESTPNEGTTFKVWFYQD